jgi:hypothetical protein
MEFSGQEDKLHKTMADLRNKVYAHSDREKYSVRPWRSGKFSTDIVGTPVLSHKHRRRRSAETDDKQAAARDPSQDEPDRS